MLNAGWQRHPGVLAVLPNRDARPGKRGIGERTHGNCHRLRRRVLHVVDGRSALATEVVRPRLSLVGGSGVSPPPPIGGDTITREPSLEPERAPRPVLAREAMADRHPQRLPFDYGVVPRHKLAQMTSSAPERYVRLGLQLGRHLEGIVDAYFGPPELAAAVHAEPAVDPRALVVAPTSSAGG